MKTMHMTTLLFATLALAGCMAAQDVERDDPDALPLQAVLEAPESLVVSSPEFEPGAPLSKRHEFDGFGCTGDNALPALEWAGAPEGTKSYAVVVHDPDAPTGVGFFHWIALNIPATVTTLSDGVPEGVSELHTDYGVNAWGGPCPPVGREHRYVFTVYALDVERLELPASATGALTRFNLAGHTLAFGRLVGTYQRSE